MSLFGKILEKLGLKHPVAPAAAAPPGEPVPTPPAAPAAITVVDVESPCTSFTLGIAGSAATTPIRKMLMIRSMIPLFLMNTPLCLMHNASTDRIRMTCDKPSSFTRQE